MLNFSLFWLWLVNPFQTNVFAHLNFLVNLKATDIHFLDVSEKTQSVLGEFYEVFVMFLCHRSSSLPLQLN